MTQKLTKARIDSLCPRIDRKSGKRKAWDVSDGGGAGLLVRVQPSGRKYFYVQFRRPAHVTKRKTGETRFEINTTRIRLGRTDHIGLSRARELAREAANAARSAVSAGLTGDDVRQVVNQQLLGLDKTPSEMTKESEHKRRCPTVSEFIDDTYGPYKQVETKYCADGREMTRLKHVLRVLGESADGNSKFDLLSKKLYEIDGNLMRSWLTKRLSSKSTYINTIPSRVTVLRELNMMRAMFKHAVACDWVESNPLDGITIKAKSKRKVEPLKAEEEDRLLKILIKREKQLRQDKRATFQEGEFADFLRPIIMLAMHTGMRFGELASLTWDNVDLASGSDNTSHRLRVPDTKNNETLEIPLNDFAATVLRKWRIQCVVFDTEALVFQNKDGGRLKSIRRLWAPVFREAGLPKGYRFHDLRHHFASKLVMSGVPLFAVQSLLNHSSPTMTQRYAKFAPDWMEKTVGKLSEDAKWTL